MSTNIEQPVGDDMVGLLTGGHEYEPTPLTTHEPRLARTYGKGRTNPLGQPLVIRVQGACTCGWRGVSYSLHSSVEGWALGKRDAHDHAGSANRRTS